MIARKWNHSERRGPGRSPNKAEIRRLIVRMSLENRAWGYMRIRGALANAGYKVGRGTVANVLKDEGIEPAPERGRRRS